MLGLGLCSWASTEGDPVDHAFIYGASVAAGGAVGIGSAWLVGADAGGVLLGFAAASGYYGGLFVSAAWHDALSLLPCAMFMMAVLSGLFLAAASVALILTALGRRR